MNPAARRGANLSLRQFEYLVTTVSEGRMTRAARQLHVTEPTLSQQLRTLERMVGTQLLVRGPEGVRPTRAGEAFLPYARAALRSAAHAQAAAHDVGVRGTGASARLVTLPSALPGLLPALSAWSVACPEVQLRVSVFHGRSQLQESVVSGAADFAVGPRPVGWEGVVRTLGEEEVVVVCGPDDPLRGGQVPVESLLRRRWISYPESGWAAEELLAAAGDGAAEPGARAMEVPGAEMAVELAAQGVGLTAVPHGAVPDRLADHLVRIVPRQMREVTLFWAADAPEEVVTRCNALVSALTR